FGLMFPYHMADILAQEALYALAKLPRPVNVPLIEPPILARPALRLECRDHCSDLPVFGDVRYQVPEERKRLHRLDGYLPFDAVDRGLAHEPWPSVYLR